MKFKLRKNKSPKPEAQPPVRTLPPQKSKTEELSQILAKRRKRRIGIFAGFLTAILILASGFYFFFLRPYNEGMKLIKLSEEQVASKDLTSAMKSLARAHLVAPFLKGLYYREALVGLRQMEYGNAESLLNEEIRNNGFIAGAELTLGFIDTVDAALADISLSASTQKTVIEELSNVLDMDIALDSKNAGLNLEEKEGYSAALSHFARAAQVDKNFEGVSDFGLAYVHALRGDRDSGLKSFSMIASARGSFPALAGFYEGIEPKLGASSRESTTGTDETGKTDEKEETANMPEMPVGDLPPIPDDININPPPDISMPSSGGSTGIKHIVYKQDPTVRPFKLSQYQSKTGEMKWIVTLLNIHDRGQTVAREGQRREMPNTHVEVLVVKLSEKEIILKEDNLYTFTWIREGNNWIETEDESTE